MARPGFVLEVDEKTPPLLRLAGSDVGLERFALGTQVLYPPDAVPSSNPVPLIDLALENPLASDPLSSLMGPDQRVTIAVSADQPVQPRMRFDVRRTIVERVLEMAARSGVDDIEIVIGSGLRRGWTSTDMVRSLGERVATSFLPDALITNHDVTAADLVTVGEVDGRAIRLNPRLATSDLVIVVGATTDHRRPLPVAVGFTDVDTINSIQGIAADPGFADGVAALLTSHGRHFAVTAVLGQPLLGQQLSFLNRREWEWRLPQQSSYALTRQLLAALPRRGALRRFGDPTADYAVVDVLGGDLRSVHEQACQVWHAASGLRPQHRADVLITSVWGPEFDAGNPIGTPIGAAHHALVERAGAHTGVPLLREGGVLIAHHPLTARFPQRAQGAAADFFTTVIPETLDSREIHARHEQRAMHDDWYIGLYRQHFADHPLRVFHDWYRLRAAMEGIGEVIWVGGDRANARLLGHRAATTLADALEIATARVGAQPRQTYLRSPGRVVGHLS